MNLRISSADSIRKELDWLLSQRIPIMVQTIHQCMSELSILPPKATATRGDKGPNELHQLSSETGRAGSATVCGTIVTQLSLDIATNKHITQEAPVHIYQKKNETLPIRQAQEAQGHVLSALAKTNGIVSFTSQIDALEYLEGVLRDICMAKQRLTRNESRSHCQKQELLNLQSGSNKKFAPTLAGNVVIECSLEKSTLIVHVYWLRYQSESKSTGILDSLYRLDNAKNPQHTLVHHDGQVAQVKQKLRFHTQLENIKHCLVSLERAESICRDAVSCLRPFDCM